MPDAAIQGVRRHDQGRVRGHRAGCRINGVLVATCHCAAGESPAGEKVPPPTAFLTQAGQKKPAFCGMYPVRDNLASVTHRRSWSPNREVRHSAAKTAGLISLIFSIECTPAPHPDVRFHPLSRSPRVLRTATMGQSSAFVDRRGSGRSAPDSRHSVLAEVSARAASRRWWRPPRGISASPT